MAGYFGISIRACGMDLRTSGCQWTEPINPSKCMDTTSQCSTADVGASTKDVIGAVNTQWVYLEKTAG
jgi:hypothetical protein